MDPLLKFALALIVIAVAARIAKNAAANAGIPAAVAAIAITAVI
jgi:hypothetical protein